MTTKRSLRLDREIVSDLTPDDLRRVSGGATNRTCVQLLCAAQPTLSLPCYQSSECSHPCA